jgi:thiol-disulfide isomerase/thioredoxin
MKRRYVLTHAVALTAAAVLLAGCTNSGLGDVVGGSGSGTKAEVKAGISEFSVKDRSKPISLSGTLLSGGTLDLASLRGKVVVINVWGSWCGPCRDEAPALVKAYQQLHPQGVAFLGIDTREPSTQSAKLFLTDNDETWPSLLDSGGQVLLKFHKAVNPTAIPTTLVLDRQGRVAARVLGVVDTITLTSLVATVLQEKST